VTEGRAHDGAEGRAASAPDALVATVAAELRVMLAEVTGRDDLLAIPPDTALFGGGVGLDSLAGTLLLRRIERSYGVDVAAEDLNLDALETLGSLADFIADRI